jgi:hypothetical protein
MGATERIVIYLDFKGISKYKFCKELGFSNKFLDNSNNMGTDKACKILHHYPEINPEWIITGNGEMLKKKVQEVSVKAIKKPNDTVESHENSEVSLLRDQVRFYKEKADFYEKISKIETRLDDLEYFDELIRFKFKVDLEIEKTIEELKLEELEKTKLVKAK